ncbi:MAG: glycosyltransferase [Candidatus Blackburnbacteria bacterium]|nr:glycosyltransferase [Candidatus Blackburnbacteria bacterium]
MKIALVYDRVNKWGGAERVLLAFHEMFPGAPLYTSVCNFPQANWAEVFPEVIPSFLQKMPLAKTRHDLYPWLMPMAFESFNFDQYDVVVSVTSEFAKGIITKPGTFHICYCLTPTRYLWSGYKGYLGTFFRRTVSAPLVSYLRDWDLVSAQRPDVIVAISNTVAERIKRYYGRESEVIYPPVDIKIPEVRQVSDTSQGYFLIVSRLVPYKKVDMVVDVFNKLNWPLIIVGTGSEENKLKKRARSNVRFVGQVGDVELAKYYSQCEALIFPQEEDFGLVVVEVQKAGRPVIAYRRGGAVETIEEGRTGMFFEEQIEESLMGVLRKFDEDDFDVDDCKKNARKFSKENFFREFAKLI